MRRRAILNTGTNNFLEMISIKSGLYAFLLALLFGAGCTSVPPTPEWFEEKAFLEDAIRWYWTDSLLVLESLHTDSGNYLANINPVMRRLRDSKYFSERFCDEIEEKYELCDAHYRHERDFERHECLDSDLITDWTYPQLDSIVIKEGFRSIEGVKVVSEIYAAYGLTQGGRMDKHENFEITFTLIKVNNDLRIDNTSANEDHFFFK